MVGTLRAASENDKQNGRCTQRPYIEIYTKEHGEAFLSSGFIPLKVEIMLIIILFHDS